MFHDFSNATACLTVLVAEAWASLLTLYGLISVVLPTHTSANYLRPLKRLPDFSWCWLEACGSEEHYYTNTPGLGLSLFYSLLTHCPWCRVACYFSRCETIASRIAQRTDPHDFESCRLGSGRANFASLFDAFDRLLAIWWMILHLFAAWRRSSTFQKRTFLECHSLRGARETCHQLSLRGATETSCYA